MEDFFAPLLAADERYSNALRTAMRRCSGACAGAEAPTALRSQPPRQLANGTRPTTANRACPTGPPPDGRRRSAGGLTPPDPVRGPGPAQIGEQSSQVLAGLRRVEDEDDLRAGVVASPEDAVIAAILNGRSKPQRTTNGILITSEHARAAVARLPHHLPRRNWTPSPRAARWLERRLPGRSSASARAPHLPRPNCRWRRWRDLVAR